MTDASLSSRAFNKRLTAISAVRPTATILKYACRFGLYESDPADWLDIQYLAKRTRCITRLIYLPFVPLAFLIVSRSELFDDFILPWTIVVMQALSVALVIGSVVSLRLAAEKARVVACDGLNAKIIAAVGHEDTRERPARL